MVRRDADRWASRQRHLSDAVRVALGLAVLVLAALPVRSDAIGRIETAAFTMVNALPDAIGPGMWAVMQLGALAAVPVLAVIAFVLRRRQLSLDLAASGVAAWLAAKGLKAAFDRARPGGFIEEVIFRGPEAVGLGFVSGHTAVAVALATAAAPYVPRRFRWILGVLALSVGIARIYVGAHLPLDVVGGAGAGWAVGAAWRLAAGAPATTPSEDRVAKGLEKLRYRVDEVTRLAVTTRASAPCRVRLADGRILFAKVIVEEIVDRDVLVRLWRAVAHSRAKHEHRFSSPREQVSHEAAATLAAERAGVRCPKVVDAARLDPSASALLTRWVDGERVEQALDEDQLRDLLQQLRRLHDAGMAHGAPARENLLVSPEGVHLVDFGHGRLAATPREQAEDVLELLVSLAAVEDGATLVRTARDVLGGDAVEAALSLDSPRFSSTTEEQLRGDPDVVERLRRAGPAGRAADVDEDLGVDP